jgi:hypothetical protein
MHAGQHAASDEFAAENVPVDSAVSHSHLVTTDS